MEASPEMENIKKQRTATNTLLALKVQEVLDGLVKFEKDEQKFYINGKAESIKEHCVSEKEKIKIREPNKGQDNE